MVARTRAAQFGCMKRNASDDLRRGAHRQREPHRPAAMKAEPPADVADAALSEPSKQR